MSRIGVTIDGHSYTVDVRLDQCADSELTVVVNGETLKITVPNLDAPLERTEWVIVGNRPYEIVLDPDLHWIRGYAGQHRLEVQDLDATVTRRVAGGDGRVKAPIPGLISRLLVSQGQEVALGQPLLVLEAMKMENEICAPRSGTVREVNVKQGQDVALHHLLLEIA